MRNGSCCRQASSNSLDERPRWSVAYRAVGWILPGVLLAAMPKCPLCLAAYVALFTGLGISLAAAKFAWWLVAIGCVAVWAYLAASSVRRFPGLATSEVDRSRSGFQEIR